MAAAAQLYGQGYSRNHIAELLLSHLSPRTVAPHRRKSSALRRLRKWEKSQEFRDLVWSQSLIKLDLQAPAILGGIAKKAVRGRVDAARLALEITGRHNPKGDAAPTQIAIVVNGVPRPSRGVTVQAVEASEEVDDEV